MPAFSGKEVGAEGSKIIKTESDKVTSLVAFMLWMEVVPDQLRNGAYFVPVDLNDLAVISDQTVGFVLYVAYLRQHGGTQTILNRRNNFVLIQADQRFFKIAALFEKAITVRLLQIVGMALDFAGIAAKFRKDQRFLGIRRQLERFEIDVFAFDVAAALHKPAGSRVIDSGRVCSFQHVIEQIPIVLPPPLVKYGVIANRWMVMEQFQSFECILLKCVTPSL